MIKERLINSLLRCPGHYSLTFVIFIIPSLLVYNDRYYSRNLSVLNLKELLIIYNICDNFQNVSVTDNIFKLYITLFSCIFKIIMDSVLYQQGATRGIHYKPYELYFDSSRIMFKISRVMSLYEYSPDFATFFWWILLYSQHYINIRQSLV